MEQRRQRAECEVNSDSIRGACSTFASGEGGSNMASNALVQTRIDADVKERATAVLENMGLTVSDAVRILLTRTAKAGDR